MDRAIDLAYALMFKPGATNGLRVDEQAPPRRSVVSAHMRQCFCLYSGTPGLVLACWRVEKRGMARRSVESIRHAMSQRK
jgi:hypothetical protein